MKIVFLAPFGIRPKGTLIARILPIAAELQLSGHEVVIIAPPYTNPDDSGRIEIVRGVRICNVHLGPSNKFIAAPVLAWRLFKAAYDEKADIVHLFKPKGYSGLAAVLHILLQQIGIKLPPLFIDADDWEGSGGMNELRRYSWLERKVFRSQEKILPSYAKGVTVASRTLQSMVWGMGILPDKVLYLPNGSDITDVGSGAGVRKKLGIDEKAPVVLLYTRFFEFDQEKIYFLFSEIYKKVPEVRFLVVGKGSNNEEERLISAGRERGFASALVMAGWVHPEELPDHLSVGDVAVYPFSDTLVNRAKCPAKLVELLRAERAVVADAVGQITEYIKSGTSGMLCDPDDWQEMADTTSGLLLKPAERQALGKNGRLFVLERFSWKTAASRLEKFYTQQIIHKEHR